MIYKFKIGPRLPFEVAIQPGYKVLSVKTQGDDIVLYAQVDPSLEATAKLLAYVVPTGAQVEMPENARFVETVMFGGGTLVFHVFVSDTLERGGRCSCGAPKMADRVSCGQCWSDFTSGGGR